MRKVVEAAKLEEAKREALKKRDEETIIYVTNGDKKKKLSPNEYAVYMEKPGDVILISHPPPSESLSSPSKLSTPPTHSTLSTSSIPSAPLLPLPSTCFAPLTSGTSGVFHHHSTTTTSTPSPFFSHGAVRVLSPTQRQRAAEKSARDAAAAAAAAAAAQQKQRRSPSSTKKLRSTKREEEQLVRPVSLLFLGWFVVGLTALSIDLNILF